MDERPAVSVVVPFRGSDAQLSELIDRLGALALRPSDELIVADNGPQASRSVGRDAPPHKRVTATGLASPGAARNAGAAIARSDWLVFIDADTDPQPDLLDAYFEYIPAPGTGVLAGAIQDVAEPGAGVFARHAAARGHLQQATTLIRTWPYAQSANMAVRASAFDRVNGFEPDARAGEDADLCYRLAAVGFAIETRPAACVRHVARGSVTASLQQLARHGAGAAWCERRYPGSFPPESPSHLLRRIAHSARVSLRAVRAGQREQATFAALEIPETLAFEFGRHLSNAARPTSPAGHS